ncbi:putative syntaxin-8B [Madurella mycetomatis]|uniref:Syntaxin-8B n=1 Tax=Madurella mycetomatis TaxID=100816 RepID=A0A175VQA6_9PEZI|nr:putative syntaxin-8B [Madurella mycetomatis]
MSNPNALLLLADHIKLSLLEQQRAKTLNLRRDSQDGHISRSLDQFREGLDALEKEQQRLQEAGDEAKASSLSDTLASLRKQYSDLTSQFHGFSSAATSTTLTSPNDPSLAEDFAHAQSSTSSTTNPGATPTPTKKAVRFSSPATDLESQRRTSPDPNRSTLFGAPQQPYRDDPADGGSGGDDDTAGYRDHIAASSLSNQQIHAYHQQILADQDAQLDVLGASISRQRELSLQIGDELDSQVLMLDESERAADRQASALGRARRQVGRIARGAANSGEGRQMTAIVVLIVVLVLLIIILK